MKVCVCVCVWPGFSYKWEYDTITHCWCKNENPEDRKANPQRWGGFRCRVILRAPSYRAGSFAFPAVWVEAFLFVCEGFGLRGKHSPFFTPHFLPFLTEQDADGSKA